MTDIPCDASSRMSRCHWIDDLLAPRAGPCGSIDSDPALAGLQEAGRGEAAHAGYGVLRPDMAVMDGHHEGHCDRMRGRRHHSRITHVAA